MTTGYIATAQELQLRYLAEAIETATPEARLVMLYDRLELDLRRADAAFEAEDLQAINDNLIHAQEILLALADTLQMDRWQAAPRLAALYGFLHGELVGANLHKDRRRAITAAAMVGELAEAWRQAVAQQTTGPAELASDVA